MTGRAVRPCRFDGLCADATAAVTRDEGIAPTPDGVGGDWLHGNRRSGRHAVGVRRGAAPAPVRGSGGAT